MRYIEKLQTKRAALNDRISKLYRAYDFAELENDFETMQRVTREMINIQDELNDVNDDIRSYCE